jgi:hypothetical protein
MPPKSHLSLRNSIPPFPSHLTVGVGHVLSLSLHREFTNPHVSFSSSPPSRAHNKTSKSTIPLFDAAHRRPTAIGKGLCRILCLHGVQKTIASGRGSQLVARF